MMWGVTYTFFVLNVILCIELFIGTSNFIFVLVVMPVLHVIGLIACELDPFYFELWKVKFIRTPPTKTRNFWGCNSYMP